MHKSLYSTLNYKNYERARDDKFSDISNSNYDNGEEVDKDQVILLFNALNS